jgi:predicted DNA-binding protein
MGRGKLGDEGKVKTISVRLNLQDKWDLVKVARFQGVTTSELMRQIINEYLDKQTHGG